MTKELPCLHCGQDLHIPARYNAENIAQLEAELADLKTSHSYLQFKYSSETCAKQNAISTSVRLEAELTIALSDAKNMHANWDAACNDLAQLEAENAKLKREYAEFRADVRGTLPNSGNPAVSNQWILDALEEGG